MDRIVGQADADQHLRQTENAVERRHGADRAAGTDEHRRFAEAAHHRPRGRRDRRMIARGLDRAHVTVRFDLDAHAGRRDALQVLGDGALDVRGILRRHEARRKLGARERRYDRLAAGTLIAAVHAVDFERRPAPHAFERRETGLAREFRYAEQLRFVRFVVRQLRVVRAFRRREFAHAVVETGDGDAAGTILQRREHLGERFARVAHDAAVVAGVQVARRTAHRNFPVHETTQ